MTPSSRPPADELLLGVLKAVEVAMRGEGISPEVCRRITHAVLYGVPNHIDYSVFINLREGWAVMDYLFPPPATPEGGRS